LHHEAAPLPSVSPATVLLTYSSAFRPQQE
jgi:hypothetical protein